MPDWTASLDTTGDDYTSDPAAGDGIVDTKLTRTSGTLALAKDIRSGTAGSQATSLTRYTDAGADTLVFLADNDGNGLKLWESIDGTEEGTIKLTVTDSLDSAANLIEFNGQVYFTATTTGPTLQLYKTDTTSLESITALTALPANGDAGMATDGTHLFFTADIGNGLQRLSLSTTDSMTVLDGQLPVTAPSTLTAVGNNLFYSI